MSATSTLNDLRSKLDERRRTLGAVISEATVAGSADLDLDKVTTINGTGTEKVHAMRAMNEEIDDLARQIEAHIEQHGDPAEFSAMRDRLDQLGAVTRPAIHGTGIPSAPVKSIGRMFVESDAYIKRIEGGPGPTSVLDAGIGEIMAATMTTAAGWAPESIRMPGFVEAAMRPLQFSDIVPTGPTTQAAVKYMEETTATNAAAERAENGTYAESALALTERTAAVKSIGTSLPITDEQLEDVDACAAYVDGRLMFFVKQRLDGQLLTGDGTGSNLTGYLNASNLQTQAKGADTVLDAIYKAMVKVRTNGRAFPTHTIIHPTDWQGIRLLKTVDGVYIWGNPADAGPERVWGTTVVQSDAGAAGTALTGDFSPAWSVLSIRRGVEVQVGYVSTDFVNGRVTVRAGMRGVLAVYRGAAFCKATGL